MKLWLITVEVKECLIALWKQGCCIFESHRSDVLMGLMSKSTVLAAFRHISECKLRNVSIRSSTGVNKQRLNVLKEIIKKKV